MSLSGKILPKPCLDIENGEDIWKPFGFLYNKWKIIEHELKPSWNTHFDEKEQLVTL